MAWFVKALNKDEKGFTLIELIVVIAILGILAAIAIPRVTTSLSNAKTNADKANAQIIGQAAERYLTENATQNTNVTSVNDINTLVQNGYLNQVPKTSDGKSFSLEGSINADGTITVTVTDDKGNILYPQK